MAIGAFRQLARPGRLDRGERARRHIGCGRRSLKKSLAGIDDNAGDGSGTEPAGSDRSGELARLFQEDRLDIWAFGTAPAPFGLGLKEAYLWSLTPCEFHTLRRRHDAHVERSQWQLATIQATLYNAHFRGTREAQYEPADFLGTGNREARQKELDAQRRRDAIDLMNATVKLTKMKPNEEPPDLPVWARR